MEFYILGSTNDTDGGGLSDAYERLLGLNTNNRGDDFEVPLVGLSTTDAISIEQEPTNTATFLITRTGGHLNWPLTTAFHLSGTASISVNYALTPGNLVSITPSNLLVTFPAGQTNVSLTLTAIDDHVSDGTKTATLTVETNSSWGALPGHTATTAWILEQYTKVYTTIADFKEGVLDGLEAAAPSPNGQLQFKNDLPAQFPFINVACSGRGTVARINTTNGSVVGEYRTAPMNLTFTGADGPGPQPSRTTVDQYGNVWVANRDDTLSINETNYGSITRIGLIIGGTRFDKIGTSYVTNTQGQYVRVADATYNTCIDRDGDGYIRTSSGLGDILAWNNGAGVDSQGGVSTAEDEAITEYTRVLCTGTRTIAVDRYNDIWVGGHDTPNIHLKVNGLLGVSVPNTAFAANSGGYGGVIDGLGHLWSSEGGPATLLWLAPSSNYPPQEGADWQLRTAPGVPGMYGIAADPRYPFIWQANGGVVFRWNTNGTPITDASGNVILHPHGNAHSQGLAVDTNGHVWVAHCKDNSSTVGHLDTNGTLVGVVTLSTSSLWAEYFDNTNLAGLPIWTTNDYNPVDYSTGWPEAPVPANRFSARWSGTVQPLVQGNHVFYVKADAGAAFRLRVNGTLIIDNWTNPASNAVELSGTNWLGTNVAYDLKLEYVHFSNAAQIKLSWMQPGIPKEVIPIERYLNYSSGATGISVDATGKIWAGCYNSSTAVRIDPNAGAQAVINGVTNYVGLVDMVVNLGDGTWHPAPYNQAASPYNYSDMTGLNERVVNPGLKPLKGYWITVNDSGNPGQLWNKVSWTYTLTNGCSIEVYVRASDDRKGLGSATFTSVTNNVFFPSIRGRYIEVRLAMTREDAAKQPVIYDLTLQGTSSSFSGEFFLDDAIAYETEDATFHVNLTGAEPMSYQWFRMYPWETNLIQVGGATNSTFTLTNVDFWLTWETNTTRVACLVSNGNGEVLWLGPAYLDVWPTLIGIPGAGTVGAASRYPATIHVFDQPTNFNRVSVSVTLWGLNHNRSADVSVLLVSPLGKSIMLMSNVGGDNGVSGAILRFVQGWSAPSQSDPLQTTGTSPWPRYLGPSNYGQIPQMPRVGTDPPPAQIGSYSVNLNDLENDGPNGIWKLYIYDGVPGASGNLSDSWELNFKYQ